MKAMNELEARVLAMVEAGAPIHGLLREVLINMQLRELERKS